MTGTQVPIPGLLLACAVTFGVGYWTAPCEMLDEEVHYDGIFRTDTSKVLSTTVESLRQENKLMVFTYKGGARVWAERTRWVILQGRQELYVPAVISYHVDLSRLTMANVSYDEQAKLVRVKLPPLEVGEIAFQPENATTLNGGLLTFDQAEIDDLNRMNCSPSAPMAQI
ncbi:hypothetical protein Q4610_01335 [Sphingobium sp. HBC34]|uniref:Uncharacterized protein n=1 Tax=Sphingobium cyanobacteriorum TaxID=3063954 RepID=A0ABT8ZHL5_9SPHN|nr:hypothetical protein [Sphingobium sp. HBC34]MDO7833677.1 hypothetical protein [Sphingobium sp. HBC34]